MSDQPPVLQYTPPPRLKLVGIVALCLACVVIVIGVMVRLRADRSSQAWTTAQAIPTVRVINLKNATGTNALVLPGDIEAFNTAPIHARVPGYLKRWYVDIGARVKAGQLLADIDAPDLDQQLAQAKANLATAIANQQLAQITARRWQELLAENAVAQQDADDKNGDLAAKTALVAAGRADVDQLQATVSFERITAPFDGVVTTRSTDIGALISAATPTDTPLFTVVDDSKLRIYVSVPQSYTAYITPGMQASFTVPEYPSRSFAASLVTTADAITPGNGSLLVQFQADNRDHALKPGDYAQVHFTLPANAGTIRVPASALMFRDTGPAVAVVGPGGKAILKPIMLGRDLGTVVEVVSGLTAADHVIDNPPDSLRSGDRVRVAANGGTAAAANAAR